MNGYKNECKKNNKSITTMTIMMFLFIITLTYISYASPTLENVILQNDTFGNLICSYNLNDSSTSAAISWYKNSDPLAFLYLPFNGGEDNALLDYSGNNNNAQSEGTLAIVTDGISGDALSFDGTSGNSINISSINVMSNNDFTISLWFKNSDPNLDGTLLEQSSGFFSNGAFMLRNVNGRGYLTLFNDSNTLTLDTGYQSTHDTNWHNIVAVHNENITLLYLDGNSVSNTTDPVTPENIPQTLFIGRSNLNSDIFNGSIDEVRIYKYSLSPEQILSLYLNPLNDITVSNEVNRNDTWQCMVTGFDLTNAGPTYSSNILIVSDNTTVLDTTPPVITLNGLPTLTIEINSPYIELGANATDVDGQVNVTISGFVDTSTVGAYLITYNAQDSSGNNATPVIRTINVINSSILNLTAINSTNSTNVSNNTTTYTDMQSIPSTCSGGDITSDNFTSGRLILCENGTNSLLVSAWNKPSDTNPQFFEMYNENQTGTGIQICLLTTCISDNGFAKSPDFPIMINNTIINDTNITVSNSTNSSNNSSDNSTNTILPDTTPPVITLNGDSEINIDINSAYIELGANATDNIDGTDNVTISGTVDNSSLGTYNITYNANDSSGNNATPVIRIVRVTQPMQFALNDREIVDEFTKQLILTQNSTNVTTIIIPNSIDDYKKINLSFANLMDENQTVFLLNNLTLSRESSRNLSNYTVYIPSNVTIQGDSNWNGILSLPTLENSSNFDISGLVPAIVISLGNDNSSINFSAPVRIVIENSAGNKAAWGTGTELNYITTQCDNDTSPTNINMTGNRECYISSGNDLVIWTFHFTNFAAVALPVPSSSSSSGSSGGSSGGGGGSYIPFVTINQTSNQTTNNSVAQPISPGEQIPGVPNSNTNANNQNQNANTLQNNNQNSNAKNNNSVSQNKNAVTGNTILGNPMPNAIAAIIVLALIVIVISAYFIFSSTKNKKGGQRENKKDNSKEDIAENDLVDKEE